MSKTNDTKKIRELTEDRPLADSELDAVSGGRLSPLLEAATKGKVFKQVEIHGTA